ncbi:hypothetical protein [Streptomyces sp. A012304]|uniref:hypothetical protein n=1 Tax=Streptomyces sp. A012304 TaxID=375446 RepID=UPI0022316A60|nr:hypothetical protein [Streptomyces sp. A012304]GKQ33802.1 hypothetical protein ALMP_03530 [Streptomyces sp. A012304]
MAGQRPEAPGENGTPIPRDLPDQQVHEGEKDPWDASSDEEGARTQGQPDEQESATDVPDTDEAGTGRRGAPHAATVHPEQPVPDEPSA